MFKGIGRNYSADPSLVLLVMLVGMILIPESLLKNEDNEYLFSSAGYFEKFLK